MIKIYFLLGKFIIESQKFLWNRKCFDTFFRHCHFDNICILI